MVIVDKYSWLLNYLSVGSPANPRHVCDSRNPEGCAVVCLLSCKQLVGDEEKGRIRHRRDRENFLYLSFLSLLFFLAFLLFPLSSCFSFTFFPYLFISLYLAESNLLEVMTSKAKGSICSDQ